MFYRIIRAPPGYPAHQTFMLAAYETLACDSCKGGAKNVESSPFFESLEDARKAIPADARRLPCAPEYQFIELWESCKSQAEP